MILGNKTHAAKQHGVLKDLEPFKKVASISERPLASVSVGLQSLSRGGPLQSCRSSEPQAAPAQVGVACSLLPAFFFFFYLGPSPLRAMATAC